MILQVLPKTTSNPFSGANQVGAKQNSDKSSDDEIVIAVVSICHTKPCIRLLF